jgi:hypothetical protein
MKLLAKARCVSSRALGPAIFPLMLAACGGDAGSAAAPPDNSADVAGPQGPSEGDDGLASTGTPSGPAGDGANAEASVESCRAAAESSSNQGLREATARAIELGQAAPPDRALDIVLSLEDLAYDFSELDIPEREAQLAPSQDAVAALVEQHGGAVVSRFWLTNMLSIKLPARHVAGAYCWPEVVALEITTPYWDAVPPPWDTSSVGSSECPLLEGACPAHCEPIEGLAFDAARACLGSSSVVACNRVVNTPSTADEKCRAHTVSGQLAHFGGHAPTAPGFANYRECTEAEHSSVMGAPFCER